MTDDEKREMRNVDAQEPATECGTLLSKTI
jgi:hypothetical protein